MRAIPSFLFFYFLRSFLGMFINWFVVFCVGDIMEMEQIVKLLIFVVILVVLVGGIILLLSGRGGEMLDSIRNVLRFGR